MDRQKDCRKQFRKRCDNRKIVFGGFSTELNNELHKLDLTSDTWSGEISTTGTKPTARRYLPSVVYGDFMFVFGGQADIYQTTFTNWI